MVVLSNRDWQDILSTLAFVCIVLTCILQDYQIVGQIDLMFPLTLLFYCVQKCIQGDGKRLKLSATYLQPQSLK